MKRALGVGLGFAMAIAGQNTTYADTAETADGAYRLGEIVVSATPQSIVENAGTTYRITAN